MLSSQAAQSVNKALEQFVKPRAAGRRELVQVQQVRRGAAWVWEGPSPPVPPGGVSPPGPGRSVCMCTLQTGRLGLTAGGRGGQGQGKPAHARRAAAHGGAAAVPHLGPEQPRVRAPVRGAPGGAAPPTPVKALPLRGSHLALGAVHAGHLQV